MEFRQESPVKTCHFNLLTRQKGVRHLVTTRKVIGADKTGLSDFSLKAADGLSLNFPQVEMLARALNIQDNAMIFMNQTHSDRIRVINAPVDELVLADAIITPTPGICLWALSADCVPILLFDPVCRVVAAIHAGWRGAVQHIAAKVVKKMMDVFGSDPRHLIAGIGPSAGPGRYEVGADVKEMVEDHYLLSQPVFSENENGRFLFDMWQLNCLDLISAGLIEKNIEISGLCTMEHNDLFFSYRMEQHYAGRFGTGICLV